MFRSVLVPLDGSPFGEQALPTALSLARWAKAELKIVHVHTPLVVVYGDTPAMFDLSLDNRIKEQHQAYLARIVHRLASQTDVPVQSVLLEGEIVPRLLEYVADKRVDLVVMTTHGRGPVGRFWLGSVADELVRHLPMPTLLLRPQETPPDWHAEVAFRHILLPLNGAPLGEQIIEPATALGRLTDAEYTLLRVVPPVHPVHLQLEGANLFQITESVSNQIDVAQKRLTQEAESYLDGVARLFRDKNLRVQTRVVVHDQPAVAILEEKKAMGADLVALETHGRHGLSRLIWGSVADKVIRGGSLPVLVHCPVHT
jgi:nucleotide-binding universal stress UspA family protein